jgi:hypothetical protein
MKVKTPEMISFEVMSKAMNSRIFKATIDDVENVRKGLLRLERFDREKLNYKVSDEEIAKRKIVFDILEELLTLLGCLLMGKEIFLQILSYLSKKLLLE